MADPASESSDPEPSASAWDEEPELVSSDPCPECGRTFTAAPGAWPDPKTKLGAHMSRSHGLAKPPKGGAPRRRKASAVAVATRSTGVSEPGKGRAPTYQEWQDALGEVLSKLSHIPAGITARSDPVIPARFPPERHHDLYDALEDKLALSPRDAEVFVSPIARRIAAAKWNKTRGRAIIENRDLIGAVSVVVAYVVTWRQYLADRTAAMRALSQPAPAPAPQMPDIANGTPLPRPTDRDDLPADYPWRMQ